MSARVEYVVQWPSEPVNTSPPKNPLKPDMRLTIPRCSHCGPLNSLEAIEWHNSSCANGGEREYPKPVGPIRAPEPITNAEWVGGPPVQ